MIKLLKYTFLLLILSFGGVSAQSNVELGINLGMSTYFGDLDGPTVMTNIKNLRPAYGGFVRVNLNNHFAIRLNYMQSQLVGADSLSNKDWQLRRNLSFKSSISEVAAMVEYNLFDILSDDATKRWTLFGSAGIASLRHNPMTQYENRMVELQPLGTEGQGLPTFDDPYALRIFTFPISGGLKFKITDKIILQMELMNRITFFDYLDDVSTDYVGYETLIQNGSMAAELGNRSGGPVETGDQRGTPNVNDYYTSGLVSLVVRFGELGFNNRGEGCPYSF